MAQTVGVRAHDGANGWGPRASWRKRSGSASWRKRSGSASWRKRLGSASWRKRSGSASWHKRLGSASWRKRSGSASWRKRLGSAPWRKRLGSTQVMEQTVGVRTHGPNGWGPGSHMAQTVGVRHDVGGRNSWDPLWRTKKARECVIKGLAVEYRPMNATCLLGPHAPASP